MRKIFLLCTFLLFSSLWYSCSHRTNVVLEPNKKYEKVNPNDVILYLNAEDLPANYEKVGLVYKGYTRGLSKKIEKARIAASEMGANGLYWRNFNGTRQGFYNIAGDTIVIGQQQTLENSYLIAIRTN